MSGAAVRPRADHGYVIHRSDRTGYVNSLHCQFCEFAIGVRALYRTGDKSGQGAYNRARGQVVAHLYRQHRDALAAVASVPPS